MEKKSNDPLDEICTTYCGTQPIAPNDKCEAQFEEIAKAITNSLADRRELRLYMKELGLELKEGRSAMKEISASFQNFLVEFEKKKATNGVKFDYIGQIEKTTQIQMEKIQEENKKQTSKILEKLEEYKETTATKKELEELSKRVPSATTIRIFWILLGGMLLAILSEILRILGIIGG